MKTILITGSTGGLGNDATHFFISNGFKVLNPEKSLLDITKYNEVEKYFNSNNNIDYILHCAAYTQVDLAEKEIFKAFLINHYGTLNLITFSEKYDIPIVYISTDYVFDGEKKMPYLTNDIPNPINIYGKSKLAGENVVQKLSKKFYIVRTSWLYGLTGKNFVSTILKLSKIKTTLDIVDDQIGCPTFTYDLLAGIYKLIIWKSNYGIYHICSSGYTSWYGFAQAIFKVAKITNVHINPIKTEYSSRNAKRPKYSVMYNNKLCGNWIEGLENYFNIKYES